jgi:hypothetical protein
MCGAIPLLLLCILMTCTGITWCLCFQYEININTSTNCFYLLRCFLSMSYSKPYTFFLWSSWLLLPFVVVQFVGTGIALLFALSSVKESIWCSWDAESNVIACFGCRWVLCMLYRLAEGIWPCKLEQINADLKGNWYQLVWKKIDQ